MLVEKPVGIDEKEAAQLEEAVARANVCFMAGYSFRYIAAWQKVRELLQAGAVGEVHTVAGSIGLESPPKGRTEGSTFWLDIPVTLTRDEKQTVQAAGSD